MFQGDDNHTTTPPGSPASVAVSTLSPKPKYSVTRSQVMKRAWQLAKLNRGNVNNKVASAWADTCNGMGRGPSRRDKELDVPFSRTRGAVPRAPAHNPLIRRQADIGALRPDAVVARQR